MMRKKASCVATMCDEFSGASADDGRVCNAKPGLIRLLYCNHPKKKEGQQDIHPVFIMFLPECVRLPLISGTKLEARFNTCAMGFNKTCYIRSLLGITKNIE